MNCGQCDASIWVTQSAWHLFVLRKDIAISGHISSSQTMWGANLWKHAIQWTCAHISLNRWATVACHNNIFSVDQMTCASRTLRHALHTHHFYEHCAVCLSWHVERVETYNQPSYERTGKKRRRYFNDGNKNIFMFSPKINKYRKQPQRVTITTLRQKHEIRIRTTDRQSENKPECAAEKMRQCIALSVCVCVTIIVY